jgi:epoxide hydrolase-like predicted phosphatase
MTAPRTIQAVIFDLGGVVFDSPLALIRAYEERHGLPQHFVAGIVGGYGGADGAWHRLERGETSLAEFCRRFDADVAAAGQSMSTTDLMREMAERSAVRPEMIAAIRALRGSGLKVAALTNNWITHADHDERLRPLREEFHVFVESCKVGLRKPDPRIYTLACEELGVPPGAAVFLDDIGSNLKAARALGMTTIKVEEPGDALLRLGLAVGLELV